MTTRSQVADPFTLLAYRFKAYSLHAAREIADLLIARYEERVFGGCLIIVLSQVSKALFSLCPVRVRLLPVPAGTALTPTPQPRAALSTSLPLPALSLSFAHGKRPQFSGSAQSTGLLHQSPVSFDRLSQLMSQAVAVVCSRLQSQSASTTAALVGPAAVLCVKFALSNLLAKAFDIFVNFESCTAEVCFPVEAVVSEQVLYRAERDVLSLTKAECGAETAVAHAGSDFSHRD